MAVGICEKKSCGYPIFCGSLCKMHFALSKYEPHRGESKICEVDGCVSPINRKHLCTAHLKERYPDVYAKGRARSNELQERGRKRREDRGKGFFFNPEAAE